MSITMSAEQEIVDFIASGTTPVHFLLLEFLANNH